MKQHKIVLEQESINKGYHQEQFNIKDFKKNLQINIISNSDAKVQFEMIHIQAPIANALRRIMIAEIPTMAIHKVQVIQNTSIIPDEVLAHRLGLIPILADPSKFIDKDEQEDYNEKNSIKFNLHIKCEKKPGYVADDLIENQFTNTTVYSKSLIWEPIGNQAETFRSPIKSVHDNIIIAKLRENQEIHLRLICQKGVGAQHAKWSPVCTSFYKLMPSITLKSIQGERATKLKELCPMKVFGVKKGSAYVENVNACTSCRECIREVHGFNADIELAKIDDHFLFTIESVGQYKAYEIMLKAIEILKQKAQLYLKE